jgi:hypothetical protein
MAADIATIMAWSMRTFKDLIPAGPSILPGEALLCSEARQLHRHSLLIPLRGQSDCLVQALGNAQTNIPSH